jgi:hypothetical protein
MWDMGTGVHDATLTDNDIAVCGLAVHVARVFCDSTIHVWVFVDVDGLRTLGDMRTGTAAVSLVLGVDESRRISGSQRMWGLESLDPQHTRPPADSPPSQGPPSEVHRVRAGVGVEEAAVRGFRP